MEYKDYYKIMGVKRDAGAREIRSAFRRLARRYHPDVNPGDPKNVRLPEKLSSQQRGLFEELRGISQKGG